MPDMPVCPHTLLFALFAILVTTSALNLRTDATSDDWRSEFSKLKAEFDHENGVLQQRVKAQDAKIAWLESQISASGAVRASRCAQGTTLLRNLALSLRFSITYRSCFQRREGRRNCTAGHLSECVHQPDGRFGSGSCGESPIDQPEPGRTDNQHEQYCQQQAKSRGVPESNKLPLRVWI